MVDVPFLRWNDFDNTRLHAVLIDFLDKRFEASELVHCLTPQQSLVRLHQAMTASSHSTSRATAKRSEENVLA